MRYRQVGASGLRVSVLGVGCNAFGARVDQAGVDAIVGAALDAGITLFDTADVYQRGVSEEMLGRALASRRHEAVIATKFGMDVQGLNGHPHRARASRRYVRAAVEGSLRRLGTDHIDLYQLHTPDRLTPVEETLSVLGDLVAEGKIGYVGCSNFSAWEVVDAVWVARTAGLPSYVSAQNEYSLYNRSAEAELVPACLHLGVGVLPYFPLAFGLLTGKYRRGEAAPDGSRLAVQTERLASADFDRVERLADVARAAGVDLLSVAIGGLAAQPAVASVIAGVSRATQIPANVAAAEWIPSTEEQVALDEAAPPGVGAGSTTFATPR